MSRKLVRREGSVMCLSLSCKNAAVQDMTATVLEEPLLGVEHFLGNGLKNDICSMCNINCHTAAINKSKGFKRGTKENNWLSIDHKTGEHVADHASVHFIIFIFLGTCICR
ncbi:hypothetical protein ILYODFUR_030584 [Ilyodon furcidens]|uniref:Uncharacterized protein n=1 Tax=Ilyodon furcidens TaxID=33524 RepID=A0ABV0SQI7_9TELE